MDCRTHRPEVSCCKFWSLLMDVSRSIQAQSTPNLRIFLTPMCSFWPCGSRVVYPTINGLVPSPPRLNNGVSLKVLFLVYPWFTPHDLCRKFIWRPKKSWFAYKNLEKISFCLIPDAILKYVMFSPGRTLLMFLAAASSSRYSKGLMMMMMMMTMMLMTMTTVKTETFVTIKEIKLRRHLRT